MSTRFCPLCDSLLETDVHLNHYCSNAGCAGYHLVGNTDMWEKLTRLVHASKRSLNMATVELIHAELRQTLNDVRANELG